MTDAPDNASYLLNAPDTSLKKSKVLKTDKNFYQVSNADTTKV